jgi:dCMP deaminase
MSRISRQQRFMEVVRTYSKSSTCHRGNVGAIIVRNNRQIAEGYNGPPAGQPHCVGHLCPGRFDKCERAVHAEINALQMIEPGPFDLYCSSSPCSDCAEALIDAEIQRLFFENTYRDTAPLIALHRCGVEIYRVTPAGYVLRYPDEEEIVEL